MHLAKVFVQTQFLVIYTHLLWPLLFSGFSFLLYYTFLPFMILFNHSIIWFADLLLFPVAFPFSGFSHCHHSPLSHFMRLPCSTISQLTILSSSAFLSVSSPINISSSNENLHFPDRFSSPSPHCSLLSFNKDFMFVTVLLKWKRHT